MGAGRTSAAGQIRAAPSSPPRQSECIRHLGPAQSDGFGPARSCGRWVAGSEGSCGPASVWRSSGLRTPLAPLAITWGVDHGGLEVRVPKELLHRADVIAVLEQVRGEAVTQRVTARGLGELRLAHCALHRALDDLFLQVMSHRKPGVRVVAQPGCGQCRRGCRKTVCTRGSNWALLCGSSTLPLEVSLLQRRRPYLRMAQYPYLGYTFDGEPKLRVGSGQGRAEPARAWRRVCRSAACLPGPGPRHRQGCLSQQGRTAVLLLRTDRSRRPYSTVYLPR